MAEPNDDRSGRDSRLLGLVIVIALAVLMVLARFRFSDPATRTAAVAPGPLERLAARATFDDLAGAVYSALQRVQPTLVAVALESDPQSRPPAAEGAETRPALRSMGVRLRDEWVVTHVPEGWRVAVANGERAPAPDAAREVAFLMRGLEPGEDRLPITASDFQGFAYVCVVEATAAGEPTGRPAFIGRVTQTTDERWGGDVLVPGGSMEIPAGALVFRLDGRFVGLAARGPAGQLVLIPAALLESALPSSGRPIGDSP
jgi:hypothetical protein